MQKNKLSQEEPLVSIRVVTYNQVNYIRACLDGILMQKTNFPFEIVVGEDCSTDGTREIVFEYQEKYPNQITVITSDHNVGVRANSSRIRSISRGKYYAVCDGDDYWSDSLKLQKQVDFLESHPDYVMVYSDIKVVNEKNEPMIVPSITALKTSYKSGNIFWDLWSKCFINTNTVIVRAEIFDNLSKYGSNNLDKWFIYDYWFWLHLARMGKIKYIDEKLSTYRYHSQGISRSKAFYHIRPLLVKLDLLNDLPTALVKTTESKNRIVGLLLRILFSRSVSNKYKRVAVKRLIEYPPSIKGAIYYYKKQRNLLKTTNEQTA